MTRVLPLLMPVPKEGGRWLVLNPFKNGTERVFLVTEAVHAKVMSVHPDIEKGLNFAPFNQVVELEAEAFPTRKGYDTKADSSQTARAAGSGLVMINNSMFTTEDRHLRAHIRNSCA